MRTYLNLAVSDSHATGTIRWPLRSILAMAASHTNADHSTFVVADEPLPALPRKFPQRRIAIAEGRIVTAGIERRPASEHAASIGRASNPRTACMPARKC